MDPWRKAHKQLLAFSRYTVFYISKLYFYVFINVCGSRLFSNPVTYMESKSRSKWVYIGNLEDLGWNRVPKKRVNSSHALNLLPIMLLINYVRMVRSFSKNKKAWVRLGRALFERVWPRKNISPIVSRIVITYTRLEWLRLATFFSSSIVINVRRWSVINDRIS